eukprot:COSAG02_NODE_915_length_15986_cov_16.498584_3_plen_629_part_00
MYWLASSTVVRVHASCVEFCAALCRPLNIVCATQGNDTSVKMIDFDASAKYGEACHLKFSSAYANPQLAAELLRYEDTTGCNPVDAPQPPWAPWDDWVRSQGILTASVANDVWAFGILAFKMCAKDGASMFLSSEADNIVRRTDLEELAYKWNQQSPEEITRVVWSDAADMILKCLQAAEASRPKSFAELLEHPFFNENGVEVQGEVQMGNTGQLNGPENWSRVGVDVHADALIKVPGMPKTLYFPEPVTIRAQRFHSAIESGPVEAVTSELLAGGIHLMLVDESRSSKGERVIPLMRAAFVGDVTIAQALLGEIEDSWPDEIRKEYLDQRTCLGFTAYMIACACGHQKIAKAIKDKGCSLDLVNVFEQTGDALLLQVAHEDPESSRRTSAPSYKMCENLEAYLTLLDRKAIVMSCPEKGTLNPRGEPPYDQPVMDKINELRQRGRLKGGFDRAGSSNIDPRDDEIWPKIFKTEGQEYLFETDEEKRKELIKKTYWFTGYRTAAKAQMNLECQTFDGTLEVICIKGGSKTDVEHEEMDLIIEEARRDAAKNGIQTNIQLKKVSYMEFLCEYDPESLSSESEQRTQELDQEPQDPRAAHGDLLGANEGASPAVRPMIVQLRSVCVNVCI